MFPTLKDPDDVNCWWVDAKEPYFDTVQLADRANHFMELSSLCFLCFWVNALVVVSIAKYITVFIIFYLVNYFVIYLFSYFKFLVHFLIYYPLINCFISIKPFFKPIYYKHHI